MEASRIDGRLEGQAGEMARHLGVQQRWAARAGAGGTLSSLLQSPLPLAFHPFLPAYSLLWIQSPGRQSDSPEQMAQLPPGREEEGLAPSASCVGRLLLGDFIKRGQGTRKGEVAHMLTQDGALVHLFITRH